MLTLLKAGIFTTVQDRGRFLGAHLGIPISGAMDRQSADLANLILGNDRNDALLECTYSGPGIIFHAPTLISIVGAKTPVFLNDLPVDSAKAIPIKEDDRLTFGKMEQGCRLYIGVKGGILSKKIYNSRSTCATANILNQLKKGDQLEYIPYAGNQNAAVSIKRKLGNHTISVFKGPEYSILSTDKQQKLFDTHFSLKPESNRMAFRINHSLDLSHSHSILSSGTIPGTMQLTPSGELIVLMRDTHSTGGYPRILQLTDSSISDLSQLMPNEYFVLTHIKE